jgi:beta-lactam-binding protein with PASTA domain
MGEEPGRPRLTEADTAPLDDWPVDPLYAPPLDELPNGGDPAPTAADARSNRALLAAGLVVALAVVLGLGLLWALTQDSNPPARAAKPPARPAVARAPLTVPGLVGETLGSARRSLNRRGLKVEVRQSPSRKTRGTVLAQSPGRGTRVAKGHSVLLVVAGPAAKPATAKTTAAATTTTAPTTTTSTASTTTTAKTTTTTPAAPAKVLMPKLVGASLADAQQQLRERGLHSTVEEVSSTEQPGTVLAQHPVTGSQLRRGMTVTLRVAKAPAPVAVPDVKGLDETAARSQLTDAGFDVTSVDQTVTDPSQDGVVVGVDPSTGSRAPRGSTVTITIGQLAPSTSG